MELYQLKYISSVAKCGSVAKASDELYVSRQAISKAIRSLEQEIGQAIFDRNNGMYPTVFGRGIIEHADKVLNALEELALYADANDGSTLERESLSLAFTAFPLDYLFFHEENETIALINEFADRSTDCSVTTYMLPDAAILSSIQDGTIDIGFVHGKYEKEGIKIVPLYLIEMRVITLKDNPICKKAPIKLMHLKDVPIRSPLDFDLFAQNFRARCRSHGFEPEYQEVPLNDMGIHQFCARGGVHIQPYDPLMETSYPDSAFLPFDPNDRDDLPLCMAYKEDTARPLAMKLVNFLRNNSGN